MNIKRTIKSLKKRMSPDVPLTHAQKVHYKNWLILLNKPNTQQVNIQNSFCLFNDQWCMKLETTSNSGILFIVDEHTLNVIELQYDEKSTIRMIEKFNEVLMLKYNKINDTINKSMVNVHIE